MQDDTVVHVPTRIGAQPHPPALVLLYAEGKSGKSRKRVMPLRKLGTLGARACPPGRPGYVYAPGCSLSWRSVSRASAGKRGAGAGATWTRSLITPLR